MNLHSVNGVEVKERNPFGVWALTIVTLGIYYLVWYYKVNKVWEQGDRRLPESSATELPSPSQRPPAPPPPPG